MIFELMKNRVELGFGIFLRVVRFVGADFFTRVAEPAQNDITHRSRDFSGTSCARKAA